MITIKTNMGDIVITLASDTAPKTCENFLAYVEAGFFEDTIFHRVIPNFMIQGGGHTADMERKITEAPIENEGKQSSDNKRGTLAMARTNDPHSASSQFFINLKDNAFLNYKDDYEWGYCTFGEVTEGMDVVDAIAKVPTTTRHGHQDVPEDAIIIESVTVSVES